MTAAGGRARALLWLLGTFVCACGEGGSNRASAGTGGASFGGAAALGGTVGQGGRTTSGGAAQGGSALGVGGTFAGAGQGGIAHGGTVQGGASSGGTTSGGTSSASGGLSAGGTSGSSGGGEQAGATSNGAAGSSGGALGGSASGGSASGGAAGAAGAPSLPTLRIASDTSSIEYTPALVAAQDFYAGQASVVSGGISLLLTDTTIDLGTNAETQALRQSVDHPNLRIIFTTTETFYRIVTSKKAGIEKLADLRGKRVGTIANTSAAFYLDKMLRSVQLTSADVTVVSGSICLATPCATNTFPSMIQRGTIDAMTLWEPTAELSLRALGTDGTTFQDRSLYREIVNLHTTAEKLADPAKRRGIVEFVRALAKAQELFRTKPEMVWPRISQAIGVDAALLESVWEDERFAGSLTSDIVDVLDEEEDWVAKQSNRTRRTRAQLEPLVDRSVALEALGQP